MGECKTCGGKRFSNYYTSIVVCADCSDDMSPFGVADYFRSRLEIAIEALEYYDDKEIFEQGHGLDNHMIAREALEKIKGED